MHRWTAPQSAPTLSITAQHHWATLDLHAAGTAVEATAAAVAAEVGPRAGAVIGDEGAGGQASSMGGSVSSGPVPPPPPPPPPPPLPPSSRRISCWGRLGDPMVVAEM